MVVAAINGMLASLDPHSSYLDRQGSQRLSNDDEGRGIRRPRPRSHAGGRAGARGQPDRRYARRPRRDDVGRRHHRDRRYAVQGLSLKEAVDKMRGPAKTSVRLKVSARREQRGRKNSPSFARSSRCCRCARMSRAATSAISASPSSTSRPTTGCRRRSPSSATNPATDKLKGYILDLRNNPGGLLTQSIEVVNAFVDTARSCRRAGARPIRYQDYNARAGDDLSQGKPLVVLINGGSASASEIVSGALAGPQARHVDRHALVRQGVGPDGVVARRRTAR